MSGSNRLLQSSSTKARRITPLLSRTNVAGIGSWAAPASPFISMRSRPIVLFAWIQAIGSVKTIPKPFATRLPTSLSTGNVSLLSAIHRALLWHSPLSWYLHRQIVRTAEHVSDDAAIAVTHDRVFYAGVLVQFMRDSARGR